MLNILLGRNCPQMLRISIEVAIILPLEFGKILDSQGNLRDDVDEANLQKRITIEVLLSWMSLAINPKI
jgi:hypothetical protein